MSVEENLRVIDRWVEAYNAHDFESFAKPFAETAPYGAPSRPEPLKGREAIRKHYAKHPAIYSDAQLEKVRSFGQGDLVCVELIWTATNKGPLPGPDGQMIPPTNRSVRLPFVAIFEFEEAEIVEAIEYYDMLTRYTQLGLTPWVPRP